MITLEQDRANCRANVHYYVCFRHPIRTADGPGVLWEWPHQENILDCLLKCKYVVIPKARQLGLTTLVLAYICHRCLFEPGFQALIFSRKLPDSKDLLARISWSLSLLAPHLRPTLAVDNADMIQLANGSCIRSFPARGSQGDSYTANVVFIDECDLIDSLDLLLTGAKPTIDHANGQLILLSRINKAKVDSSFQRIVRAALAGDSTYTLKFVPWYARPDRTQAWYDAQVKEALERTGYLDFVRESYPSTIEEALAPTQSNRRFPYAWLQDVYDHKIGIPHSRGIAGFTEFVAPHVGAEYRIGADPAEGDVNSCDSAACVARVDTGAVKQVGTLVGKFEPRIFANGIAKLSQLYNNAPVLVERNNHGHAVILELQNLGINVLEGPDGKSGFNTNQQSKIQAYDDAVEQVRTANALIHDQATLDQLAMIQSNDLNPPEGFLSDRAIAWVMTNRAAMIQPRAFHLA